MKTQPMDSKARLHFARFEFKYILSKSRRDELEKELQYFMSLDPFVDSQLDYQYFVRSLYFDDPFNSCYRDKVDGLLTRWKFRVRGYAEDPDSSTLRFLEMKGRQNNLVFKHRIQIDNDDHALDAASGEELGRTIVERARPSAVQEQFHFELLRKQLGPVVAVDYHRRPYVSKYDPEFRLTFDNHLKGRPAASMFAKEYGERSILPGYSIMEVKFRFRMPAWFHRLVQSFELRRTSISKVCKASEVCELVADLD